MQIHNPYHNFKIKNGFACYAEASGGKYNIYSVKLSTGKNTLLCAAKKDLSQYVYNGNTLVWSDGDGVHYLRNDTVYDILNRAVRHKKIHMECVYSANYGSVYVQGINHLYEFSCGELSGWMYKVNGIFPNYGCSKYVLKNGDKIEWVYTCDLGRDVGGYMGDISSSLGGRDANPICGRSENSLGGGFFAGGVDANSLGGVGAYPNVKSVGCFTDINCYSGALA